MQSRRMVSHIPSGWTLDSLPNLLKEFSFVLSDASRLQMLPYIWGYSTWRRIITDPIFETQAQLALWSLSYKRIQIISWIVRDFIAPPPRMRLVMGSVVSVCVSVCMYVCLFCSWSNFQIPLPRNFILTHRNIFNISIVKFVHQGYGVKVKVTGEKRSYKPNSIHCC